MELWIISQDKECVMKVDRLDYDLSNYEHRIVANGFITILAKYPTKKRALEILNEIANAIANQYIVKPNSLFEMKYIDEESKRLEYLYPGKEFIMESPGFEIKPINTDIYVYEMPQE